VPKKKTHVSPRYTNPAEQRLWEEFLRDGPRAVQRWKVHKLLRVSLWDGVDAVVSRARHLLDSIPPAGLASRNGAPSREIFSHALNIWAQILLLVYVIDGRKNSELEKLAFSLQTGLIALKERDRGFDEPFLRARTRSPDESRETLYIRTVKAVAAEACEALLQFGAKDAARQVADIINRNDFLPRKINGKAVVARSVLNWHSRLRSGDLKFIWLSERWGSLFPNAYRLFREGRPDAARRRAIRYLPIYIKEERRMIAGN
jgi:hypothetical protein